MKKSGLFFVFMIILLLYGCNRKDTTSESNTEMVHSETVEKQITEQESKSINIDVTGTIPDWIAPYVELEQCSEPVYLGEANATFSIKNNQLLFPESNLLIVSKEIAGDDMKGVTGNKQLIVEVLNLLQEERILDESETVNPDGHYLNMDFDLIFLTVEGKYALMEFDLFEDGRMKVDITSEDNDMPITFWMKSEMIADKIKQICEFKKYELSLCEEFENIDIYNSENQMYSFSDEEIEHFKSIVTSLDTETMLCSGPYDIRIVGKTADREISMKWCNDGCGILAIEGYCYIVDESDKQWIQELIDKVCVE